MSDPDLAELAKRINAAHAAATGATASETVSQWRYQRRSVPVEERDGKLYAGDVQVVAVDHVGRVPIQTLLALDIVRWNYRLRRCVECGGRFIGPHSALTCSDACQEQRRRRQVNATNHRVAERRLSRRRDKCDHCGGPMGATRSTRRYCSPKCRQAAHRKAPAMSR